MSELFANDNVLNPRNYDEVAWRNNGAVLGKDGRTWYVIKDGKIYSTQSGVVGYSTGVTPWREITSDKVPDDVWKGLGYTLTGSNGNRYKKGDDGLYTRFGTEDRRYGLFDGSLYSDIGASDATWDPKTGKWVLNGYEYMTSPEGNQWEATQTNTNSSDPSNATKTWRENFGAGKSGTFGGLTYDAALARQKQLKDAGYNVGELDGKWGTISQGEWTKYQQKLAADKATADAKAKNDAIAATSNWTNDQLLKWKAGEQQLSTEAEARRQKLLKWNSDRANSLNFNGVQYANETDYNTAVKSYNDNAMAVYNKAVNDANASYEGRRRFATQALTPGVQARRENAYDNLSSLAAGTSDLSSLSNSQLRDMRRQLRRDVRAEKRGLSGAALQGYTGAARYTNSAANITKPEIAANYSGNAALTDEQLSATTFKRGGVLNYAKYING